MMVIASLGEWATRLSGELGYLGLFAVMVAENLFPPIPSEAILPLAGVQVSRGALTFAGALAVATAGSLAGAAILYAVGRFGGRPLVLRLGPFLRVTPKQLERADAWFDRHGAWIVVLGRLVPGARSIVSIPAGMSEMPPLRFGLLTLAGSLAWNAVLIGAGRELGASWQTFSGLIDGASTVVIVVLCLATAALIVRSARRSGRRKDGPATTATTKEPR
jgi:membrane protein DedA with SNARE-associated domain